MKENNKQKINSIEKESKNRNTNVKMHNGNIKRNKISQTMKMKIMELVIKK